MRWLALALALTASTASRAAVPVCLVPAPRVERPWSAAAGLGADFGFFYSTHGRLELMASRRLWRRVELGLQLGLGFASDLVGFSPAARAGVVFPLGHRVELALALRGGYAAFWLREPTRTRWLGSATLGFTTEVRLRLGFSKDQPWWLWLTLVNATTYLQSPLWGATMGLAAGMLRRF